MFAILFHHQWPMLDATQQHTTRKNSIMIEKGVSLDSAHTTPPYVIFTNMSSPNAKMIHGDKKLSQFQQTDHRKPCFTREVASLV
jgi:hypothetical protein